MPARNYPLNILMLLGLGKGLSVYDLSKILGRFDRRVSNGTIVPVMNRLMELDYVSFSVSGRRKVYRLTKSGKRYVASVKKIREGLKKNAMASILGDNAVYLDLLASVDDMNTLERVLDLTGDAMTRFLGAAFRLQKEGKTGKVAELNEELKKLVEEFS